MYNMELTFRVEILILIVIVFFILFGHVCCSCSTVSPMEAFEVAKKLLPSKTGSKKGGKEGFAGASINSGQSSQYSLSNYKPVNTSSWFTPDLTYTSGKTPGAGVQNILNRPEQPIPLPPGEMLMFANTEFKPECCPTAFSNSSGCACMTVNQYNYLIDRGGNNVPYSEY